MEEKKIYIQYMEPDKKALAMLLTECKGPDRTMAQMGEAAGLSPSMLSRINKGNITKPLPEDTLVAIFENRAQGCSVKMNDLYRANGMVTVEERDRMSHGMEARRMAEAAQELAQQTIINELLDRGYAVKADIARSMVGRSVITDKRTDSDRGDLSIRYKLGVILPELHDLSEWVFEIYSPSSPVIPYMTDRPPEVSARATIRRMVSLRSDIFLIDAWQPERLDGLKYSWVFVDEDLYNAFREYTKTARLNSAMSTILIDLNERVVVKEEWMNCPMKDDYASLFRDEHDRRPGTDYEYKPRWIAERIRNRDDFGEEDSE